MVGLSIKFLYITCGSQLIRSFKLAYPPAAIITSFSCGIRDLLLLSCLLLLFISKKNFFLKFGQTNFIKVAKKLYNNGNPGGPLYLKIHFVHFKIEAKSFLWKLFARKFLSLRERNFPRKRFAFPRTNTFISIHISPL